MESIEDRGGSRIMLVRVRRGPLVGGGIEATGASLTASEGPSEPSGVAVWSAEVENITVSALLAAGISIAPGDWIAFASFAEQVGTATIDPSQVVVSTVTTDQPGVVRPWQSVIEIEVADAALMVCRAVIEHIGDLEEAVGDDLWVRVE